MRPRSPKPSSRIGRVSCLLLVTSRQGAGMPAGAGLKARRAAKGGEGAVSWSGAALGGLEELRLDGTNQPLANKKPVRCL